MTKSRQRTILCTLAIAMAIAACAHAAAQDKTPDDALVIDPAELPQTYPHGTYHVQFQGHGNYVPVLHWRVAQGSFPPRITLEDNGPLHREAERAGEFQFVISVKDGGQPQQAVQRGFTIKV